MYLPQMPSWMSTAQQTAQQYGRPGSSAGMLQQSPMQGAPGMSWGGPFSGVAPGRRQSPWGAAGMSPFAPQGGFGGGQGTWGGMGGGMPQTAGYGETGRSMPWGSYQAPGGLFGGGSPQQAGMLGGGMPSWLGQAMPANFGGGNGLPGTPAAPMGTDPYGPGGRFFGALPNRRG